jgi:4-hydroxythreonine-4-phosphate dehydrogenase
MTKHKPRILVTMGDPAGVGPELCVRLLGHAATAELCTPIVFGDAAVLRRVADHLSLTLDVPVVSAEDWAQNCAAIRRPMIVDFAAVDARSLVPGVVAASCGAASYRYVTAAIDACLAGQADAICTGPINKEALHAAGHKYPGHTEIFAERMQPEKWCMMLTSAEITCSLVTAHVGYHEVPELLSVERIVDAIELTHAALRRMRGREPRLTICGLNPHAGEHGLFGNREEERFIEPAVAAARARGIAVEGPLPPDTAFLPPRRAVTDAYVCMYHDQGLIPLKALAFDSAINTTLGLPVVRTSVDHGTAFDIAWQGTANPNSLYEAVKLAAQLVMPVDG